MNRQSLQKILIGLIPVFCGIIVFVVAYFGGAPENLDYQDVKTDKLTGKDTRVVQVLNGWRNSNGSFRAAGNSWGPPVLSVELKNFDRWIMDKASAYPQLLSPELTIDEMKYFDRINQSDQVRDAEIAQNPEKYYGVNQKFQQWHRRLMGELRLAIAGQVFATIQPFDNTRRVFGRGDATFAQIVFRADPGATDKSEWQQLIRTTGVECTAPITVALKIGDNYQVMPTDVNNAEGSSSTSFALPLRPLLLRSLAYAAFALLVAIILQISVTTEVLRGDTPGSPWSLSRVVLAWWLTITAGCFLFLWAMTGDFNNISSTVPLLLGINGLTLVVANAGSSKAPAAPVASAGFLSDLIAEGQTPEISRVQMLIWNLVLGFVFAWQTISEWRMPVFDASLMTLLGISSTAYVGYKLSK